MCVVIEYGLTESGGKNIWDSNEIGNANPLRRSTCIAMLQASTNGIILARTTFLDEQDLK